MKDMGNLFREGLRAGLKEVVDVYILSLFQCDSRPGEKQWYQIDILIEKTR